MLIKIVKGKSSGCTKAEQTNYSCLWQERAHFRSRQKYINEEISLGKDFPFYFSSKKKAGLHMQINVNGYIQEGPRDDFAVH